MADSGFVFTHVQKLTRARFLVLAVNEITFARGTEGYFESGREIPDGHIGDEPWKSQNRPGLKTLNAKSEVTIQQYCWFTRFLHSFL